MSNDIMAGSYESQLKWAHTLARSQFCPASFKGKAEDVLVAMQFGAELGLKPLQALQNIAVINGRPSIWGDAMLALCRQHHEFEWIKEEQSEDSATCTIKRKNNPEHTVVFTRSDASNAGLWGKTGTWKTYPKRMMQMRARGFCVRDTFPDALKGFITQEEAMDIPIEQPKTALLERPYHEEFKGWLIENSLMGSERLIKGLNHFECATIEQLTSSEVEKFKQILSKNPDGLELTHEIV